MVNETQETAYFRKIRSNIKNQMECSVSFCDDLETSWYPVWPELFGKGALKVYQCVSIKGILLPSGYQELLLW